MRRLATLAFRAIVWGWFALGLGCLVAEALLAPSGGQKPVAAPVVPLLFTPYGHSGS